MLQPLQHTQHPFTHKQPQQQQRTQSVHMQEGAQQQHWGTGAQALAGLPQVAQLVALLMGALPASMGGTATPSSSNSRTTAPRHALSAVEQASDTQQAHKQQRQPIKRSSKSEAHQAAAELHGLDDEPLRQQQQQPIQQQLQQQLTAAALMMQPAGRAVQQLMLTAPPLMFLGACCHSTAAASSTAAATAADADVDGCPLAVSSAAAAAGRSRRH
jgi:hypothetical protein